MRARLGLRTNFTLTAKEGMSSQEDSRIGILVQAVVLLPEMRGICIPDSEYSNQRCSFTKEWTDTKTTSSNI